MDIDKGINMYYRYEYSKKTTRIRIDKIESIVFDDYGMCDVIITMDSGKIHTFIYKDKDERNKAIDELEYKTNKSKSEF